MYIMYACMYVCVYIVPILHTHTCNKIAGILWCCRALVQRLDDALFDYFAPFLANGFFRYGSLFFFDVDSVYVHACVCVTFYFGVYSACVCMCMHLHVLRKHV